MKVMSQNELSILFHEVLSFLMNYDEKWIRFFFRMSWSSSVSLRMMKIFTS